MRWGRRPVEIHPVDGLEAGTEIGTLGKVVGVVGPGGGSGVTTLAVSLALAVATSGRPVALIDADPQLGTVAAHLGLGEDRSLFHLVHESTLHPVDPPALERHLQWYRGLAVLAGRAEPGGTAAAVVPGFQAVLGLLIECFPLVLADIGQLGSEVAAAMASHCQVLLWVVDGSPLGADRLDRCVNSPLGRPLRSKPQMVVVNRAGPGLPPRARDWLAREYGFLPLGEVPHNVAAVRAAEERLLPAVLAGPLAAPLRRAARTMLEALERRGGAPAPEGRLGAPLRAGPSGA